MTVGNIGASDFFVRLRKIENAGLKARDIVVLYAIQGEPGIMGRTLAIKLGYASRSNVQDCVARLVKQGFIEDRRRVVNQQTPNDLHILPAGVELLTEIVPHD